MYSTGNEVSETAQPKGIRLTKKMTEYLHHLDRTRPVTCGVNIFFNFLSSIGLECTVTRSEERSRESRENKAGGPNQKKKKRSGASSLMIWRECSEADL